MADKSNPITGNFDLIVKGDTETILAEAKITLSDAKIDGIIRTATIWAAIADGTLKLSGLPLKAPAPPPSAAEKLLSLIVAPHRLEEIVGDFAEGYGMMLERHGIGYARGWYWWQVFKMALGAAFDIALKAAKIIWSGFGQA